MTLLADHAWTPAAQAAPVQLKLNPETVIF